ncbi:capsular biosynthesis protein [Halioglobus maricola]|uniref:protein-tyrosine-phosphatase n=1 Tax=Halioglobus maricola TaxID=2601894 RepID=A0A5P9NHF1_9GAMM|nr:CpsB/CapC family capsule biosynthesis tyrosine phosphatase [Halioglobus maricola]QFU74634.1 capsular biosynthesis protein [Halioglobus maricola]
MIDLHCHMLPAIDDGARDLDIALQMAQMAVDDGISMTLCTPHIYEGLFPNTHDGIRAGLESFRAELATAGIPLEIGYGADIQIVPDLTESLGSGRLPSLHGSRYFLFEPPHHVALPRMPDLVHSALVSGYVPLITHPERLTYIENDYDKFVACARSGAWIQITGGALLGRFGPRVKGITERFLRDGVVHVIASDGHNLKNRTPVLSEAREAAAEIVGEEEAWRLVRDRPAAVVGDVAPHDVPLPPGLDPDVEWPPEQPRGGWLSRLKGALGG